MQNVTSLKEARARTEIEILEKALEKARNGEMESVLVLYAPKEDPDNTETLFSTAIFEHLHQYISSLFGLALKFSTAFSGEFYDPEEE